MAFNYYITMFQDISITSLAITAVVSGTATYIITRFLGMHAGPKPKAKTPKEAPMNLSVRKEEKKVVDSVDIEDLLTKIKPGEKLSYCRCWRSETWPYCDGSHKYFNFAAGDNTGPLCIRRKKADAPSS